MRFALSGKQLCSSRMLPATSVSKAGHLAHQAAWGAAHERDDCITISIFQCSGINLSLQRTLDHLKMLHSYSSVIADYCYQVAPPIRSPLMVTFVAGRRK